MKAPQPHRAPCCEVKSLTKCMFQGTNADACHFAELRYADRGTVCFTEKLEGAVKASATSGGRVCAGQHVRCEDDVHEPTKQIFLEWQVTGRIRK